MSDHNNENPFDQPYSSGNTPPQIQHDYPEESDIAAASTRPPAPPPLIIPPTPPRGDGDGSHSHSHSPSGPNTLSSSHNKPGRRVQFPAELPAHHSIHMVSPQTLRDEGAQDQLTAALEEHSKDPSKAWGHRYAGSLGGGSETGFSEPPSRGESTDGEDRDARLEDLRENMDVYVDPGETAGLPSVGQRPNQNAKQAWGLVRAYQTGGMFRNRKNAGFSRGMGEGANDDNEKEKRDDEGGADDGDDDDEKADKGGLSGFFNKLRSNDTPDVTGEFAAPAQPASGGILSALIALQQQQAAGSTSALSTASTASSPSTSTAVSRANSDDEDSDDEIEKQKFLEKQRRKRARAWYDPAAAVENVAGGIAGYGKSALGGAARGATSALGGATQVLGLSGHSAGHSRDSKEHRRSGSESPSTAGNMAAAQAQAQAQAQSRNPGAMGWIASRSQSSLPLEPEHGVAVPRSKKKSVFDHTAGGVKNLGRSLGLEVETSSSRPDAAKSSAGVFGGLMLSTGNIAGVAAPHNTRLAPQATRPGYHLSRYSAPDVVDRGRKSFERPRSETGSRPASRAGSRAGSPAGDSPIRPTSPGSGSQSGAGSPLHSPPLSTGGGLGPRTQTGLSTASSTKNKHGFSLGLKELASGQHTPSALKFGFHSRGPSTGGESPRRESALGDYFGGAKEKETIEQREQREWEREKRKRKKAKEKRKQEEVYITMHVAAILARQDFIMKMARSFMMFGAPSHRLEAQIQATARVLEINCQVIYIPGVMLISFGDVATHTSEVKFLKQANGLDLGKLLAAYIVYWKVIHDKISVTDASVELDALMVAPPKYRLWQNLIIGGLASAFIQPSAFYGSFVDCLVSIPLGALLVLVQVAVSRNDLYSSLFEIVIACINSFLAAALASTNVFCFASVASGSVVLILPGYIVLCGSLELANRSIISGSVRLVYSILYSLFLGFGLAMGGEIYQRITGLSISSDYTCSYLRGAGAPWWRSTIPGWWYFLTCPMFLLLLALRNGQPFYRKELPIMIIIGSAGFCANHFSGLAFVNRSDISSALGSFAVGFLGNIYGKFTRGSPFVVMVPGVLFQLPSGLSNGGLLQFATSDNSTSNYSAGFTTAESLVEVAIGLTVGLFVSAAVVNFLGGGRRRGSNLSSF
ncbi:DUF1212 family protein [Pseudohyphozyma bogoriensis]|nr:DUF1212 family protein [Pseudohyphozyma bogoriensis]